jgi:hypothetical protein
LPVIRFEPFSFDPREQVNQMVFSLTEGNSAAGASGPASP